MQSQLLLHDRMGSGFQPVRLVTIVLALLLFVAFANRWHARQVSLPNYCQQPEVVLRHLAELITRDKPADENARKAYVSAAKLEFLVPRAADEPVEHYLQRMRHRLEEGCR